MFRRLLSEWPIPPEKIANKVKKFFILYGRNRHKMTVITPSVHIEDQSVDDNRYDLRPFLYNTKWSAQFRMIDEILETLKSGRSVLDWL
jgi:NAD+ synthase (glutamine-hydrolysing)